LECRNLLALFTLSVATASLPRAMFQMVEETSTLLGIVLKRNIGTGPVEQANVYNCHRYRVADPDPNPDLFGGIWIRKIFTGSGSYRYFDNVKLYKQGKNILKIEVSHIFR